MKHYGDVSKISGSQIEPVDIITFGSPCQDLSVAGKREGMKHAEQGDEETTRSGLFYEAIRIIEEMREATNGEYPKYAVWENVPGAFSSNKGRDFHAVLEAFCSVCDDTVSIPKPYDTKRTKLVWAKSGEIVGDSYSIAWRTLDAQYWGVPQRRKRIYLVADFTGRRAGEILFKQESLRGDMSQSNEAGQEVTADAVGGVDGSSGNGGQLAATVISSYGTKWNGNAGAYNGENFVLHKQDVDGSVGAAGVVSKGNGECFIMPERHMSLSIGGGQAGQGYPCTVYSFDSLSSNSMKSSNPFSGCRAVEIAKCIDTTYPDPSKNQGGIAVVTLNDQGGSSINVEQDEISPTLRANSHQHEPVIAFAQNQREEVRDLGGKAGALAAEAGAHQQTYVAQPVIALQANGIDRADTAGCNGCGWRENESYTLNTIDRHAVCFEPGAMVRDMGNRIWEGQSPTLRAKMGDNQPAVCYQEKIGALQARDYKGVGNQYVCEDKLVVECYGIGNGQADQTDLHEKMGALNCMHDQQAVCYDARNHNAQDISGTIQAKPNGGQSLNYINPVRYGARGNGDGETVLFEPRSPDGEPRVYSDVCPTLNTAQGGQRQPCIATPSKPPRKYIIRRLTPTECARLQGFPDWWSTLAPYNPADAEFWEDVRKTHAEINGKKYKPVKDIKKWYDKLHTDSAEYKMWGNGIALPNAEYVIHGIAEQGAKTLGSLFDGSGGFPLAGAMNGIKPLWASEVEPYPIAVTKSRFKEEQE